MRKVLTEKLRDEREMDRSVAQNPTSAKLLIQRGNAKALKRDFAAAIMDFDAAFKAGA